jgi:hypothetical protein
VRVYTKLSRMVCGTAVAAALLNAVPPTLLTAAVRFPLKTAETILACAVEAAAAALTELEAKAPPRASPTKLTR